MSLRRPLAAALAACALLVVVPSPGLAQDSAPSEVHPHYQGLLRQGIYALERDDATAAVRHLRLACFGMLDAPRPLADCLARLALAQSSRDDVEGFEQTFRRILEIEDRFEAFSSGALAPELMAQLAEQVAQRIPPETLEETGGSFLLGPRLSGQDREQLRLAREALASARTRGELAGVYEETAQVAEDHPEHPEAQHLAATLAYRISRWGDAVRYFRRGGDPGDDQPELLFYQAVALYETGDPSAAADALERSLPRLSRTPFVEQYRQKIEGAEAGTTPPGMGTP